MKEDKQKKGFTLWKAILLGVVVALFAVIGGAFGSLITSGNAAEIIQNFSREEKEEPEERLTVPYEEFLVNLKPVTTNDKSFLRVEFAFSVADQQAEALLTEKGPLVRDTIISVLRSHTRETIFTEAEGNLVLKTDLLSALNQVLNGDVIKDIYITNIVMQ